MLIFPDLEELAGLRRQGAAVVHSPAILEQHHLLPVALLSQVLRLVLEASEERLQALPPDGPPLRADGGQFGGVAGLGDGPDRLGLQVPGQIMFNLYIYTCASYLRFIRKRA